MDRLDKEGRQDIPLRQINVVASDKILIDNRNLKEKSEVGMGTSTKQLLTAADSMTTVSNERTDIAISLRVIVFLSFLTAAFFFNVDGAVLAPALLSIERDLDISANQIAILYGVTYSVCGVFNILTAPVFLRFEARQVLAFSALCNSIGTFMFIGSHNYYVMVLGRALSGIA